MSPPGPATGIHSRFTVLGGAVRELWLVFGTKLLTILAYGVMNITLMPWLIIALTTLITPIGLLVFRRYIQVHESGRD